MIFATLVGVLVVLSFSLPSTLEAGFIFKLKLARGNG